MIFDEPKPWAEYRLPSKINLEGVPTINIYRWSDTEALLLIFPDELNSLPIFGRAQIIPEEFAKYGVVYDDIHWDYELEMHADAMRREYVAAKMFGGVHDHNLDEFNEFKANNKIR